MGEVAPPQAATAASKAGAAPEPAWERQTIEKLAFAALKEQKTSRRWGIFFKLLTFAYITVAVVALRPGERVRVAMHVRDLRRGRPMSRVGDLRTSAVR